MRLINFLFICLGFSCCQANTKETKIINDYQNNELKEDSIKFRLIKDNLFIDQFGNLAFKTLDKSDPENPVTRFITTVWNATENEKENGKIEMKEIIDTNSFKSIKGIYYKDKSNFYVYNQMADGGNFTVLRGIDTKSFSILNGYYSKDKNFIYYGSNPVEEADVTTFKVMNKPEKGHKTEQYGKDKNRFYYFGRIIQAPDLKMHNL